MSKLADVHNDLVAELLPRMVKPILNAGGKYGDILVLLESVVAGTVAFVGNGGGDSEIIDHVAEGAKARVESMRADVKRMLN